MDLYKIVMGAIVLMAGRNLFWLLVGTVGFLAGMELSGVIFPGAQTWASLALAVGMGLLGALLTMVGERIAFALGGFLGGAYLVSAAVHALDPAVGGVGPYVIGGIAGAVLASLLMDWAIVFLSATVGATAMVDGLYLPPTYGWLIFFLLFTIGIIFQVRNLRRRV